MKYPLTLENYFLMANPYGLTVQEQAKHFEITESYAYRRIKYFKEHPLIYQLLLSYDIVSGHTVPLNRFPLSTPNDFMSLGFEVGLIDNEWHIGNLKPKSRYPVIEQGGKLVSLCPLSIAGVI